MFARLRSCGSPYAVLLTASRRKPGPICQRLTRRRVDPGFRRDNGLTSGAGLNHAEDPGPLEARLLFIGRDIGALLLGQADVVEAVEHAMLAERIDIEMHDLAVGARDRLLFEIDRQ